ncbi:unnamed protein product [Blepharisma stoltei]|uniref:Uncharacterized protein n=1 Tax=Blepharisma stoltei TaxID=1481888 RepID=A0AAU9K952_9CILI|nr:unnamed protein product [Blepharisma stoltei]
MERIYVNPHIKRITPTTKKIMSDINAHRQTKGSISHRESIVDALKKLPEDERNEYKMLKTFMVKPKRQMSKDTLEVPTGNSLLDGIAGERRKSWNG